MLKKKDPKIYEYGGIKVKQLPSGSWTAKIFIGKDGYGKDQYQSFTDPDPDEVGLQIIDFKRQKEKRKREGMSVLEAVNQYIDIRKDRSETTLFEYKKYIKNHLEGTTLASMPVAKADQTAVQKYKSDLSQKTTARRANGQAATVPLSKKTVKNVCSLVIAAIREANPKSDIHIKYGSIPRNKKPTPTPEDVVTMIRVTQGTDLGKAIVLGAFTSDRRGQVCGAVYGDIDAVTGLLNSDKNVILGLDGKHKVKRPKTEASARKVLLPSRAIALLGAGEPDEPIIKLKPHTVTLQFGRLMKKLNMPYSFHSLRHFNASTMLALGIPDKYAQKRGGWATGHVMKEVYQDIMEQPEIEYNNKVNTFFDLMIEAAADDTNRNKIRNNILKMA